MAKKVLVIEDDEQISHVYVVNLKRVGLESVVAIDGEEGLNKAISEKPDLILLDIMLQGKDGFWFLEERVKKPDVKKIPVIVLSNLGQEQDKKRALDLGALSYLVKADISIKEVMDLIVKQLA
jgi:DNA-binding response OmpR family regulator